MTTFVVYNIVIEFRLYCGNVDGGNLINTRDNEVKIIKLHFRIVIDCSVTTVVVTSYQSTAVTWHWDLEPDIPFPHVIRSASGLVPCVTKVCQVVGELVLLRQEQPQLFCVILSSIFLDDSSPGLKVSTHLLLHLAVFLNFGKLK